jgi:outer membrane protein
MKRIGTMCCILMLGAIACMGAASHSVQPKVGTVSFKTCLERSKIGKSEQVKFETMRKQLEQTIETKEKELNELSPKFSDEYLDSLTPEAETELKEKFKNLSQELTQLQNQFYQTMNQANMQVVQKLFEMISEASKVVSKDKGLDLIMNDEVCFFKSEDLDVSDAIIAQLDEAFAKSQAEAATKVETKEVK